MTNGDRLTCEIKRLERGLIYVTFAYVDGAVALEWAQVARVESKQLFQVQIEDGSIYEGALRSMEASGTKPVAIQVLESPQTAQRIEPKQVVEIQQTETSLWQRISGNVDTGLMFNKGNNTTQYNLGAGLRFRQELWSGTANISSVLSESTGAPKSTRNQAQLQGLRLMNGRRWFYSGDLAFLQSSQQGIRLQTTFAGGMGYLLMDRSTAQIALNGGLAYQQTTYREDTQSPANALAAIVGFDANLFQFKKSSLEASANLLPILTQSGRYRSSVNAAYSIKIVTDLWFKISVYGNFDNKPPAGFAASDYGTSTSLSWSFH